LAKALHGGLAVVLLLLCAASVAQVTDATVKGRVVDASETSSRARSSRHGTPRPASAAKPPAMPRDVPARGLTPGVYSLGADVAASGRS
jgi:hypothetical protein